MALPQDPSTLRAVPPVRVLRGRPAARWQAHNKGGGREAGGNANGGGGAAFSAFIAMAGTAAVKMTNQLGRGGGRCAWLLQLPGRPWPSLRERTMPDCARLCVALAVAAGVNSACVRICARMCVRAHVRVLAVPLARRAFRHSNRTRVLEYVPRYNLSKAGLLSVARVARVPETVRGII